jgi:uncharacterized protein with NAD-binding domain and iron-sulfur cluster
MTTPLKVVVIGGGCGAMTAAWELSDPKHGGRYAVTVYQEGWRLGGKGASGRGPSGRIEEHGLHIWLGFYENSFRMMRACHAELEAQGLGHLFGDWREAFVPEPDVGLFAPFETGGWQMWRGRFPPRPGLPGDPLPPEGQGRETWSIAGYMSGALAMVATLLMDVEVERGAPPSAADPVWPARPVADWTADELIAAARGLVGRGVFGGAVVLAQALALVEVAIRAFPQLLQGPLTRLVELVAAGVRRWAEDNLLAEDRHRHVWELVDLVMANLVGAVRFGLMTDPRGLEAVDDYDCREWLRLNGASERAVNSPFVQGLYDLAIACEDGDTAKPGVAAGQGLRGALRMFYGYRGSMFWRMRAGMGDTVFAPLYEVLRRRGVRFEFFHRLTNVGIPPGDELKPGERTHVTHLEFDVQARVKGGGPYSPLVEVAGRPCWPSEPFHDQLVEGSALKARGIDFESHWERHRAGTLRLEVTRDFDFVVLGVSVGAIPHVAKDILSRDRRWRDMVKHVKTTPTQAFQIWLTEDLASLGWKHPAHIAAGYVKPFDSWCDMAHVIPEEDWEKRPRTAVYFCGAMKDDPEAAAAPDYPLKRRAEAHASSVGFLERHAGALWPGMLDAQGNFRWEILADGTGKGAGLEGRARFDTQYWRANVNPSDRYVLSLPGSIKYRVSPLDMTYDNMTIAGDWTSCGLNSGCTEAAVMSGMLAASAISGLPKLEDITGYDHP